MVVDRKQEEHVKTEERKGKLGEMLNGGGALASAVPATLVERMPSVGSRRLRRIRGSE